MKTTRTYEFEDWLTTESPKIQVIVESRIFRIEHYDHFGDVKHIGNGLCELRWKNGLRVYFTRVETRVVLLIYGGGKMTKKVILKKREFSLNDIQVRKLKKSVKTASVKSSSRLKDRELVFRALWQCLVEEDIESFKDVLRGHMEAINKQLLSKKANTSRRTLYRILSPEGNPTLKNVSKVISALYG